MGYYRECRKNTNLRSKMYLFSGDNYLKNMELDRSTYEVLDILIISLTEKTHLRDLFYKTIFQNDKKRVGSNEPSLFILKNVPILMEH